MKNKILAALAMLCATMISAQTTMTREGVISFNATAKGSPEKIEAINKQAGGKINATDGSIEVAVLVKGFHFERALMEEHFNENYMESNKYKNASFKGTMVDIKSVDLKKDGAYTVKVVGKLTMHGQTKEVNTQGKVVVKGGKIVEANADFVVKLEDYKIAIPSLVKDKVAREATIKVHLKDMK